MKKLFLGLLSFLLFSNLTLEAAAGRSRYYDYTYYSFSTKKMESLKDLWQILGITEAEVSGKTPEQLLRLIKKKYLKLAVKTHPDKIQQRTGREATQQEKDRWNAILNANDELNNFFEKLVPGRTTGPTGPTLQERMQKAREEAQKLIREGNAKVDPESALSYYRSALVRFALKSGQLAEAQTTGFGLDLIGEVAVKIVQKFMNAPGNMRDYERAVELGNEYLKEIDKIRRAGLKLSESNLPGYDASTAYLNLTGQAARLRRLVQEAEQKQREAEQKEDDKKLSMIQMRQRTQRAIDSADQIPDISRVRRFYENSILGFALMSGKPFTDSLTGFGLDLIGQVYTKVIDRYYAEEKYYNILGIAQHYIHQINKIHKSIQAGRVDLSQFNLQGYNAQKAYDDLMNKVLPHLQQRLEEANKKLAPEDDTNLKAALQQLTQRLRALHTVL